MNVITDVYVVDARPVDLNYQDYVVIDDEFFRPAEVNVLIGDASKAKAELDWKNQYSFHQLVEEMVKSDYDLESKKLISLTKLKSSISKDSYAVIYVTGKKMKNI